MKSLLNIYSILISNLSDGLNALSFTPSWNFLPKNVYRKAIEQLKIRDVSYYNNMALIRTHDNLSFLGPTEKDQLLSGKGLKNRVRQIVKQTGITDKVLSDEHADLIHNLIYRYIVEFSSYPYWTTRTRNLRAGDTFVDIGAYRGYVSCKAAALVGNSGRVISVEPIRENVRYIEEHKSLNRFDQMKVVNSALSKEDKEFVEFYRGENQANSEIPDHLAKDTEIVRVNCLSTTELVNLVLEGKPERVIMSITTNGTEIELMQLILSQLKGHVSYIEITIPIIYTERNLAEIYGNVEYKNCMIYDNYPWLTLLQENS